MENTSFVKDKIDGKSCVLDVLAVLHDGTKVNIEVQLGNEYNMDRRSLFYWSKVYTESLKDGQNYRELPNVIAINIVDW
jgi:predicted transposase/invertase (TIGR01784 family)